MIRLPAVITWMRRATAWMLLWICLWMGTGATLHHTDAGPISGGGAPAAQHRLIADAPADLCAACEWTQGLQGRTVAVCQVSSSLSLLPPRVCAAVSATPCRTLFLRSPRAPPAFLPAA